MGNNDKNILLSRGTVDFSSHTISRRVLVKPLKMTMALSRSMQVSAHWVPYLSIDMSLEHVEVFVINFVTLSRMYVFVSYSFQI